jgi:acyl carrier protein
MNSEIFNRIKKFTTDQAGIEESDITESTSLETDLGIYGDDAMEYLVAFGKEFNVDLSRFMAADYFSAEGGLKLFPGVRQLFGIKKEPRKKELTIKHLMKSVEMGKLDEEVIKIADS